MPRIPLNTAWREICVAPIRFYRLFISPLLPPACRFSPSCSAYALEAILLHGPLKGGWLALRRLARCHPWGGSGFDPVPRPGGGKKACPRSPDSNARQ